MTRSRYRIFENTHPYFLTATIVGWVPIFSRPEVVAIILDSWKFLQEGGRLTIFGYCILENHLHLIASSERLSEEIGDFKSFTARQIIDGLAAHGGGELLRHLDLFKAAHKFDRPHQLWQEGSHPQIITSEEMMWQKLEYIHNNPAKRGYVDDPTHWRYSSARNYANRPGLIDVVTDWR